MDLKIRIIAKAAAAVIILVIMILTAYGIGSVVSKKVIALTSYEMTVSKENAVQTKAEKQDNSDILMYNRNLFNQKGTAEEAEAEPPAEMPDEPAIIEEIVGDGIHPVLTDLRVLLVGTQVASIPNYSVAMFMPLDGGSDARMQYLGEGDVLLGEAEIVSIVRGRVYLKRTTQHDRMEYLDTRTTEEDLKEAKTALEKQAEKEKEKAEKEKEKAAAAEKKSDNGSSSTEIVKKVGADTYEVSREVVDSIKKNPNSLKNNAQFGTLPKVQPVYKNGNVGGFRLLKVDSNSVYAKLGLKSGDTIVDVNGRQIDSPQSAMSLLDALKPGEDVGIKINRSGQEKTLTFQLK